MQKPRRQSSSIHPHWAFKGECVQASQNINSAAAQIQSGFLQCRYKVVSFQLPLTSCLPMSSSAHSQNPCCPACQNFHAISEHDVPNSVTPKVGQKQQFLPKHVTAADSIDSNRCFYLSFIQAEGISNTQMPFPFLNLLPFLQQKGLLGLPICR